MLTQIVCRGAKIVFRNCRDVKNEVSQRKWQFLFCLFYVGERQRETEKKLKKENRKKAHKIVFLGVGGGRGGLLLELIFLEKLQTLFGFGRWTQRAFSLTPYVLGTSRLGG